MPERFKGEMEEPIPALPLVCVLPGAEDGPVGLGAETSLGQARGGELVGTCNTIRPGSSLRKNSGVHALRVL